MVLAMIFALLVTTSGVDPASSSSARASASPTPALAAPILGGIALGQDPESVLHRFGLPPRSSGSAQPDATPAVETLTFPSHVGDVVIGIIFDTKIRLIKVTGSSDPRSNFADPKGIQLGDTLDRLTQIRGTPDGTESGGDLRYGPKKGVHWFFAITGKRVTTIGVADGT
jgi:hypothetical protein